MLALGGILLLGSVGPAAAAPMPITTCGALITQPGRYMLAADLVCDVTAIAVAAGECTDPKLRGKSGRAMTAALRGEVGTISSVC